MTGSEQLHNCHPQTRITNHRMHQHRQTDRQCNKIYSAQIQAWNHYSTDSGPESLQHRFRPGIITAQIQAQNHYSRPGIITAQIQAWNHYSTDSGPESLQHRFRPGIITADIQAQNHYSTDSGPESLQHRFNQATKDFIKHKMKHCEQSYQINTKWVFCVKMYVHILIYVM